MGNLITYRWAISRHTVRACMQVSCSQLLIMLKRMLVQDDFYSQPAVHTPINSSQLDKIIDTIKSRDFKCRRYTVLSNSITL